MASNPPYEALLEQAITAHRAHDYETAKKLYLELIELSPNTAELHNNLATIYYRESNLEEAIKHYAKAVYLQPDYIDAHFNLGLLFLKLHKIPEAIKQFNNVIILQPSHISAKTHLADLFLEENKLDKASLLYQEILFLQPENTDVLNNQGVIFLKLHQLENAMQCFNKILTIDEENYSARNNLAALYLQENRYENAARHYQILLNKNTQDIEAHYNLGVSQMALGELNEATTHFETVLESEQNHFDAICNLAAIYLKKANIDQAISYYQRAYQIKPQDPLTNYMLSALTQSDVPTNAPETYIQNLFDNYAGYYDKHVSEVLHYQAPMLLRKAILDYCSTIYSDNIFKFYNVLDLGCGSGLSGVAIRDLSTKLTGIDLSKKMLDIARTKNCYDKLVLMDIEKYLLETNEMFDLIIAADIFVYIGDLATIFETCKKKLQLNGLFAFSVEALSENQHSEYVLQKTARFAHGKQYIEQLAKESLFEIKSFSEATIRIQDNKPITGYLVILG
ncbi:MAG: tetratricopeptide repeat protein [Gammaproteobacteria bacterium]